MPIDRISNLAHVALYRSYLELKPCGTESTMFPKSLDPVA